MISLIKEMDLLLQRCQSRIIEARMLSDLTSKVVASSRLRMEARREARRCLLDGDRKRSGLPEASTIKDLSILGEAAVVLVRMRDDPESDSRTASVADFAAMAIMMVIDHRVTGDNHDDDQGGDRATGTVTPR